MAQLPADRTKLALAQSNQVPSATASSQKNREALTEAYDTIDALYNFTTGLISGGTLSRLSIINVKDYGAKGDGIKDDTAALQSAFNVGGTVFIPNGIYNHTGLVINNAVNLISSIGNTTILDNKGTGHGITVNANAVTIDGLMIRGTATSGSGLFLNKSGKFSNLILDGNGRYGVEFSSLVDIVSCHFSLCTISANKLGGVYCLSSATSQKNVISFINCYVVGNGDASQAGATPTSGHGYYIEGGIDISIIGGVSETNVGVGIYVKSRANYGIYGLNVIGVHLETNRYANIIIDSTSGFMTDVNIVGNYYVSLIAWAGSLITSSAPRAIVYGYGSMNFPNIDQTYSNNTVKTLLMQQKQSLKLGGEIESITPYLPFTSHAVSGDALADSYNVIRLDSTLGAGYTEPTEFATFVDPRQAYRIVYEYRYKKTTSTSASLALLQLNGAKANIGSAISLGLASGDTWFTQETLVSSSFLALTRYLQVSATINGTVGPSDYVLIRKIMIYRVDGIVLEVGTTALRPPFPTAGREYYDTTIGKPIWYNGTNWKDATGTTV